MTDPTACLNDDLLPLPDAIISTVNQSAMMDVHAGKWTTRTFGPAS